MNMFRVKPRANLDFIFFTVLIQKSEKFALWNSLGSTDLLSDDPREFPRANFSRQPLRTFHCFYHSALGDIPNMDNLGRQTLDRNTAQAVTACDPYKQLCLIF